MKTFKFINVPRGFSMIEVLISVVVLGFGLLALAALQTTIIRSSSETKAQTVALQLAKDKIEDLRSYQTLVGYQALTSGNDTVNDSAGDLGGVNFTRTWTVTRFGYQPSTSAFAAVATLTGATPAADAGGVAYVANNEYKRVAVTVSWADANGATQSIGLEDAIGAVSPGDGSKVVLNNTSTSEPRYPRVNIYDPSNTAGVIPIAVGDGTDTAATNPKPEISGNGNNQQLTETRFDVLTYAGLSGGLAEAQSRVETVVIGCTCNKGNANSADIAYRPTYWNGFRYATPTAASYSPIAGASSSVSNQSQYCTACCRDHHDPGSVVNTPKFDPRRGTHTHYKIENGALVAAGDTDDYLESCRLIRVDGIFRVAADLSNDYYNLLATRNDGSAAEFAPTATATTNYQNVVLDYLGQRIVNQGNSTLYNTLLTSTEIGVLETARSINDPASIDLQRTDDYKWLHSRGLFIDYLEPDAIDKITDAKDNCVSPQTLASCTLKYMPFTSINLTELSNFTPISGQQLVVSNNEFKTSTAVTPVRGKVVPGSNPTINTTHTAYTNMYHSNSSVAAMATAIDADETQVQDTQDFNITGSGQSNGGAYTAIFSGYTFGASTASYPTLTPTPSAICNPAATGGSRPNPYTCTTSNIGGAVSLIVGNYNYVDTSRTSTATLTCTGPETPISYTPANNNAYSVTYCKNYAVSTVNLSGTIGQPLPSDGSKDETTTISFPAVADGDSIDIGMTFQNETKTTNTCTYTCSKSSCGANGNKITYTISSAACQ
jgi:type IV pilus modification protein PilV